MKIANLVTVVVACGLPTMLCAQNGNDGSANTLPEGPLLKRAPTPSKWTMIYKVQQGAGGGKVPRGGVVVKAQNATFESITAAGGSTMEAWRVGKKLIRGRNGKDWVDAYDATPTISRTDYATSDFAGFDWISLSNFVGEKQVEGRKCLVFKDKVVTGDPSEVYMMERLAQRKSSDWHAAKMMAGQSGQNFSVPEPGQFDASGYMGEVMAYIDEETRLPVALVYPEGAQLVTRYYKFEQGPQALSIPSEVQKLLGGNFMVGSTSSGGR